jgi:hypothetical protein
MPYAAAAAALAYTPLSSQSGELMQLVDLFYASASTTLTDHMVLDEHDFGLWGA